MSAHHAASNIAYFAHVFGFVAGVLLLFLFLQRWFIESMTGTGLKG